ncbi:STAS domain-containing protein [Mycobacterium intracellulare]|uniref:STAS domain-containing protein n=1 Tax=Mycobacterium intracellulare TaxID=1767 RepID=UPI001EED8BE4|nr:STAS domain-containing protein [Mycobacterium intracellulare]MEE3750623.1 STAS domain-containing protein [Mycobacterium intracellulare]
MNVHPPAIWIERETPQGVPILTMEGVLDSETYLAVRDAVITAAIDEPHAVIVGVDRLRASSISAWTVFKSARWHVSVWPDVPILLVCEQPAVRRAIATAGVARYVPIHSTRRLALDAVHDQSRKVRRRARTELARSCDSIDHARGVVTDRLTRWDIREVVAAAATVATVFVENALDHTESAPVLIVESYRDTVTVAVADDSPQLPGRREAPERGADVVSGLAIVSAVSRAWGAAPTSSGKTVWALVGRENQL